MEVPAGTILMMLPGIGGLAYVLIELLPEWLRGPDGQRAARQVANKLNPEKLYRDLTDQLAITDTVANRSGLAQECLALGKFTASHRLRTTSRARSACAHIATRPPAQSISRAET